MYGCRRPLTGADTIGWRWAFFLQLPFIALSSAIVYRYVRIPIKDSAEARHKRVDYLGAANLVAFLTLFLLAVNSAGTVVPWTHPLVLTCLPASALFLASFVYTEKHVAREPIIPLESMKDRTVVATCLCFLFLAMSVYCAVRAPRSARCAPQLTTASTFSCRSTRCCSAQPRSAQACTWSRTRSASRSARSARASS